MLRKFSRTQEKVMALTESREEKQDTYMLSDRVSSRRNVSSGFLQDRSIARDEYAEVGGLSDLILVALFFLRWLDEKLTSVP
jgi:hypothetical protein